MKPRVLNAMTTPAADGAHCFLATVRCWHEIIPLRPPRSSALFRDQTFFEAICLLNTKYRWESRVGRWVKSSLRGNRGWDSSFSMIRLNVKVIWVFLAEGGEKPLR